MRNIFILSFMHCFKIVLNLVFLILIFNSCKHTKSYVIEGSLPSGFYDGEKVYLIPMKDANNKNVDSVYITNSKFYFRGNFLSEEIKIIRVKHLLRQELQSLLIVIEKGQINILLASISSASGTKQNDLLQQWKEKREDINKRMGNLQNSMQGRELREQKIIKQNMQLMQAEYRDYNFEFIKKYRNTIVGQFVYENMKNSLSPEQQKELEKLVN